MTRERWMALLFALGSICFLVAGTIAYVASPRHGWRPLGSDLAAA